MRGCLPIHKPIFKTERPLIEYESDDNEVR